MRHIGYRKSGRDKDIMVPVWIINEKEVALLAAITKKADLYIPDMWDNNRTRIRNMNNQFNDYLKGKHMRKVELDSGMLDIVTPDPNELDNIHCSVCGCIYDDKGKGAQGRNAFCECTSGNGHQSPK